MDHLVIFFDAVIEISAVFHLLSFVDESLLARLESKFSGDLLLECFDSRLG